MFRNQTFLFNMLVTQQDWENVTICCKHVASCSLWSCHLFIDHSCSQSCRTVSCLASPDLYGNGIWKYVQLSLSLVSREAEPDSLSCIDNQWNQCTGHAPWERWTFPTDRSETLHGCCPIRNCLSHWHFSDSDSWCHDFFPSKGSQFSNDLLL